MADPTVLRPGERALDVAVTLLVLPLALALGSLIALAIVLDSPGPVFYRCTRIGKDGRPFRMLKFRKMRACATGGPLTTADDARFTPIGRFLALTKLDELPQLFNVLRGEMRLVGPRPEEPSFVATYPEAYRGILHVLPGITGPAAIEFADESRLLRDREDVTAFYCDELLPRKIELDLEYVRTRSVRGDVALLTRTAFTPLRRTAQQMRSSHDSARLAGRLLCAMAVGAMLLTFLATGASA